MKRKFLLFFSIITIFFSCFKNQENYFLINQNKGYNIINFNTLTLSIVPSIGSDFLEGVDVKIFKKDGEKIFEQISENSVMTKKLEDGEYYVEATKEGYGNLRYEFVIPTYIQNYKLVLTKLESSFFKRNFVEIVSVQYSSDNNVFNDFGTGIVLKQDELKYLKVKVKSKNLIMDGGTLKYGVGISLDKQAGGFGYIAPEKYFYQGVEQNGFYASEVLFNFSEFKFGFARHYFNILSCDVAGNKISKVINFSIPKFTIKEKNISLTKPVLQASARTFPVDRGVFVNGVVKNKYIVLTIKYFDSDDVPIPARGFYVYRSEDDKNYRFIEKLTSSSLYDFGTLEYVDSDASLELDKKYYYKVVAYNNDYVSKISNSIYVYLKDAHTYKLSFPSNGAVTNKAEFIFEFTSDISEFLQNFDRYSFGLTINKIGDNVQKRFNFIFDIKNFKYYINVGTKISEITNNAIKFENNKVYIYPSLFNYNFENGFSYEWNIALKNHGPFFMKNIYLGDSVMSEIVSYSSAIEYASGANGPFIFTFEK